MKIYNIIYAFLLCACSNTHIDSEDIIFSDIESTKIEEDIIHHYNNKQKLDELVKNIIGLDKL